MDLVEDVANDEKCNSQRYLDHVIDHQVNKQDVPGICVEDLEKNSKTAHYYSDAYSSQEFTFHVE